MSEEKRYPTASKDSTTSKSSSKDSKEESSTSGGEKLEKGDESISSSKSISKESPSTPEKKDETNVVEVSCEKIEKEEDIDPDPPVQYVKKEVKEDPDSTVVEVGEVTKKKKKKNTVFSSYDKNKNDCDGSFTCWYYFTSCWLFPMGWLESLIRWVYHALLGIIWGFFALLCCLKVKCTRKINNNHWAMFCFHIQNIGFWCCTSFSKEEGWPENFGDQFCCSCWGLCCFCACCSSSLKNVFVETWEKCCPCPNTKVRFPKNEDSEEESWSNCDCGDDSCSCSCPDCNCKCTSCDCNCPSCDCKCPSCDCSCGSCSCGSCDC